MKCWYINTCRNAHKDDCGESCIKYLEVSYMLQNSGLPKRSQGPIKMFDVPEDKEAYDYLKEINADIKNYVKEGNSLLIFSEECGNGKTTWAMKLMTKYIDRVWNGNLFRVRAYFINTANLYEMFRENLGIPTDKWLRLKKLLVDVDLLVLDDISLTNIDDRFYNLLYNIIDARYQERRSTIYTSNITPDAIMDRMGKRLYSRIVSASDIVEFTSSDRRGEV